tara:strand:+ start:4719 stop:5159 length:441 start_codon:yes stop_codon:yes gene_type:complete
MIKLLSNNKLINLIIFLLILFFLKNINANELKPLNEILNENHSSDINSLIIMNRCAAIYGALYFINPSDTNSKEYENRYKIFLQSAVLEDIKIYNTNEEESYKKHIEEFKSSIKFFIQIYLQNYKKNNSYLKNHWLEDDFLICEKF